MASSWFNSPKDPEKERKGIQMGDSPARGPLFGHNVLPIFSHIFLSTVLTTYCMLSVSSSSFLETSVQIPSL
jgi:hypothetical protein